MSKLARLLRGSRPEETVTRIYVPSHISIRNKCGSIDISNESYESLLQYLSKFGVPTISTARLYYSLDLCLEITKEGSCVFEITPIESVLGEKYVACVDKRVRTKSQRFPFVTDLDYVTNVSSKTFQGGEDCKLILERSFFDNFETLYFYIELGTNGDNYLSMVQDIINTVSDITNKTVGAN